MTPEAAWLAGDFERLRKLPPPAATAADEAGMCRDYWLRQTLEGTTRDRTRRRRESTSFEFLHVRIFFAFV
jgi:hypothetical protein